MESKLGLRKWIAFILAGLVGQLAWAIENNYLNLYVYHCTGDPGFIKVMTAASAVMATVTTLFIGALSDRLGKRKMFISFGYIIWGISIILFAFLDPNNVINVIVNHDVFLAGSLIVIMDCVMTFFGSTANDACFNASVTENTNNLNRGKVESVLSILPLIAMIMVVLVGGIFVDGENKKWDIFFYIFGGITIVAGIISIFLYPKDNILPNRNGAYIRNIFYGFRPSVIKENKLLYISLLAFMGFNIGIQIYMPYFMVYVQEALNIKGMDFTVTLGVVLVVASIITVLIGAFMDKIGKNKLIIPSLIVAIIGGFMMFFMREMVGVMISGTILMAGYLISTAILGAKVRDYTPESKAGLFQGVRMIFVVMIPMIIGPFVGDWVSHINEVTYENEYHQIVTRPNEFIFLFAAITLILVIAPIVILLKKEKENEAAQ